jgi:hypothetical protein
MNRSNARELPNVAAGLSLFLAPLFALASALVAPALKSDAGAQLNVIAQHPDRWYWFTLLLLIGSILLVPALLGIAALVRQRSPRLGDIGGGLAVLGAVIAIGDVMSQFVSWQMIASGADHAQMAGLLDRFDNAAGVGVVFSIGGLAILIGTALLTIGLIRSRVAPAWAAVALSIAVVVNIAGFTASSNGVVALSWAVLLAAMGYIGWNLLTNGVPSRGSASVATPRPAAEAR